jgi:flagellar biosynthesis regulator FlaF
MAKFRSTEIRDMYFYALIEDCKGVSKIHHPNKLQIGKTMAIARVDQRNWLGEKDKIVDLDTAIERIRHCKKIWTSFVEQVAAVPRQLTAGGYIKMVSIVESRQ